MKIAFTICSNNYFAQAKTLGDSIHKIHPDYRFFVALVDKLSPIVDYSATPNLTVLPIEEIGIDDLDGMTLRYTLLELNTAVKPSIFEYLFKSYPEAEFIIYFDPDIYVYNSLTVLEGMLKDSNVVLTPHFTTPIFDDKKLSEPDILNNGIFNLGFIGLKNSPESKKLVDWWKIKLKYECRVAFDVGLFVDQLWINFVPVYYDKVIILKHPGYNMAYWNLHERTLLSNNRNYYVNDHSTELVFYHFSGFTFNNPHVLSKYQNRYDFGNRPELIQLFKDYHTLVIQNGYQKLAPIKSYYAEVKEAYLKELKKKNTILKRTLNYMKRKGLIGHGKS